MVLYQLFHCVLLFARQNRTIPMWMFMLKIFGNHVWLAWFDDDNDHVAFINNRKLQFYPQPKWITSQSTDFANLFTVKQKQYNTFIYTHYIHIYLFKVYLRSLERFIPNSNFLVLSSDPEINFVFWLICFVLYVCSFAGHDADPAQVLWFWAEVIQLMTISNLTISNTIG